MHAVPQDAQLPAAVLNAVEAALINHGWYAGQSILDGALAHRLATHVCALSDQGRLQSGRVGRTNEATQASSIRSDETLWISEQTDIAIERDALQTVRALREALNRSLYLGARSEELHFARYAAGAFYRRHRDSFRNDDARVLSLIFYLNERWTAGDGGELVLYSNDDDVRAIARIEPRMGTMVCFLSEQFPHEVLPARIERCSLTGWLRRDAPIA